MSTSIITADQAPLIPGRTEELAGPPHTGTAPVTQAERISSVDVLRGFALMGILLMNITSFGLPEWDYMIPLSTVHPVFKGPHWHLNTAAWFCRWVFAEGKMRALFSMLFGAGVILLTGRAEERGAGVRTADIFTRRNMWLAVFGIAHCYLIWNGDILFFYGITALLFLFPLRHLKARNLLWAGAIVLLINSTVVNYGFYSQTVNQHKAAEQAYAARAAHKPLTDKQKDAIESWEKRQNNYRPNQKKLFDNITEHQKGYVASQMADAKDAFHAETSFYFGFPDVLGMMLIGMGLLRNGFLSARLSARNYGIIAVIGLVVAWPVIFTGCWRAYRSGFDMFTTTRWILFTYDLGRIGGALGNAALLLLLIKKGALRWLMARFAAVGQMALTNYLLTSITMKLLFVWSPLHWYGYLEYYKLYLVVACMWAVNLTLSTVWLQHFRFGPVEWAWRSLTYWQKQPMRLHEPVAQPALASAA